MLNRRKPRGRKRPWRIIALLLLPALIGDYYLYPLLVRIGGRSFNHDANAAWLSPRWYYGQHTDAQVQALARHLQNEQITDAFFHVRSVGADGKLKLHFRRQARHMIDVLHRTAPLRAIAWVYAGNGNGGGAIDLNDPTVRHTMVTEALWLARDCGFDGIQWDYEICSNGDAGFFCACCKRRALPCPTTNFFPSRLRCGYRSPS